MFWFLSPPQSLFIKPLGIVPSASITTGITVTMIFLSIACFGFFFFLFCFVFCFFVLFCFFFVLWQSLSIYRSFRFLWFLLSAPLFDRFSFFFFFFFLLSLLTITRSGRLVRIRWSVCISKSQRVLCVSFSRTDSGLCIYHLFVWSN